MTTDLSIPDASYSALFAWHEDRTRVSTEDTIRRVAGPLIAAALRAFADHADAEFDGEERATDYARGVLDAARNARRRADELDPEVTP